MAMGAAPLPSPRMPKTCPASLRPNRPFFFSARPSRWEKQKNTETIVFGKKVFLDKYGYRVPFKDFFYKDSPNKIVFIGDSVLFGSGVKEEETFIGIFLKWDTS